MWTELLYASDKELRERLLAIHFYAFLNDVPPFLRFLFQGGIGCPLELDLMKQWVDSVEGSNSDRLVLSAKKVATNIRSVYVCFPFCVSD